MTPPVNLLPSALSELYVQAFSSGNITVADRWGLMAALLEDSMSEDERSSIDRILHAVRRGRLRIVDDLSAES
ncbi:MAG: hypothetical protein VKJ46_03080 [Leptolyngbyaceae bacterium]|nr:hypothetical protein [Leptolyngbyaceae bacterium]